MAGEKTEKATPKRRGDERKKGNVFQSKEVVTVFSLLIMFYSMKILGPFALKVIEKAIVDFISKISYVDSLNIADLRSYFVHSAAIYTLTAMPFLLIASLATIILAGSQTQMMFSGKLLAFKGERINPLKGLKKMFTLRSLVELIKSIIKITVLGYIIYGALMKMMPSVPRMFGMEMKNSLSLVGGCVISILNSISIVFIFLAAFDYGYQWWEHEKNLRMSKQDIKDEYKQTEGDPEIKGKIRDKQRQQAMSRMMQKVPSADVIIRNPTHYAVALKYSPDKSQAPIVVAKGADFMALKIVEVGEKNDIFITENKPLARGLYEAVDLDSEIPDKFYQAVAELLAFVYSIKKRK